MQDCHIFLKAEQGKAGYEVAGEKTDLKDLLFSLMSEDRVFASLAAIAVLDFCKENSISVSGLANEQVKR